MGQGITLTTGYGWVIDAYDGDYQGELEKHVAPEQENDLIQTIEDVLEAEQIEAVGVSFGYDHASVALVAKVSKTYSYDWYHDYHDKKPQAEAAYKRELLNALEALGWEDAKLGEPKWLHLVAYG